MHDEECNCEFCANNIDVNIPNDILDAVITGNLVLFAGSGISTERKGVFKESFYSSIKVELGIEDDISFSELMQKFCNQKNGRINFLRLIKQRFDYAEAFPELINRISGFYNELSTIHTIKDIVTTNWDDYFERFCGCVPFVTSKDFALTDSSNRYVYKIHGSVYNYGSIVATKSDYDKCYEALQKNLIGSKLKLLLTSPEKVVVFIGYSLYDEDFLKVRQYLQDEMGDLFPHSYIVTLDENISERLNDDRITSIVTDGEYFIKLLKKELYKVNFVVNDVVYYVIQSFLDLVFKTHETITPELIQKNPDLIISLTYQDGLIHGFQRVLAMKKTGYYSSHKNINDTVNSYILSFEEYIDNENFLDASYIAGYRDSMIFLSEIAELDYKVFNPEDLPILNLFYFFNEEEELVEYDEYLEARIELIDEYKNVYDYCVEISKNLINTIYHHRPFL